MSQVVGTALAAAVAGLVALSDAELSGRIRELTKQRKDGPLSQELAAELNDLKGIDNQRMQIRRRDESIDGLKVARGVRLNSAVRKLINTMYKDTLALVLKDDPEMKKGGSAYTQVQAVAVNAASEDGLKRLRAIFDQIEAFVKAGPSLATREYMLPGNIPAIDVFLSTVGIRTSTKAVDRDVDSAIATELRDEAAPEVAAE